MGNGRRARQDAARQQWQERHAAARNAKAFDRTLSGDARERVPQAGGLPKGASGKGNQGRHAQASQMALEVINGRPR
jgi:hypothetical protein